MDSSYVAAWVPEERDTGWDVAATTGVEWALKQGRPVALLTERLEMNWGIPALDRISEKFSRRSTYSGGNHTIVAYVPSLEVLAQAIRGARGKALCVVEGFGNRVEGWAATVGALNLSTGEKTEPLPDAVAGAVDRLAFVGNNGFGDSYGKRDAQRIIAELAEQGLLDGEVLSSALAAHGCSGRAQKRIRDYSKAAGWEPEQFI